MSLLLRSFSRRVECIGMAVRRTMKFSTWCRPWRLQRVRLAETGRRARAVTCHPTERFASRQGNLVLFLARRVVHSFIE